MLDVVDQPQETTMVKKADIEALKGKQLDALIEQAMAVKQGRRKDTLSALKDKWKAEADEEGFNIYEVVGVDKPERKKKTTTDPDGETRTSPAPKYRSKKNPDLTWSGRGRMASWMVAEMDESGEEKDHFLIDKD